MTPKGLDVRDLRDGRAFITVEEFASLPGSPSRGVCYEAARRGELPTVRLGSRILIPVPCLLALLGAETQDEDHELLERVRREAVR